MEVAILNGQSIQLTLFFLRIEHIAFRPVAELAVNQRQRFAGRAVIRTDTVIGSTRNSTIGFRVQGTVKDKALDGYLSATQDRAVIVKRNNRLCAFSSLNSNALVEFNLLRLIVGAICKNNNIACRSPGNC